MSERLVSAAIRRNGELESRGFKAHRDIRAALGDYNPYASTPGDQEGFLTSEGRFVSREEAKEIGLASGQLPPMWEEVERDLLSSDINWKGRP